MHILNDGARDGMVAMDMVGPFWRLLHWYFDVHFEKKTTTLMCHVNSQNDETLAYYALYIAHTLYG